MTRAEWLVGWRYARAIMRRHPMPEADALAAFAPTRRAASAACSCRWDRAQADELRAIRRRCNDRLGTYAWPSPENAL